MNEYNKGEIIKQIERKNRQPIESADNKKSKHIHISTFIRTNYIREEKKTNKLNKGNVLSKFKTHPCVLMHAIVKITK